MIKVIGLGLLAMAICLALRRWLRCWLRVILLTRARNP